MCTLIEEHLCQNFVVCIALLEQMVQMARSPFRASFWWPMRQAVRERWVPMVILVKEQPQQKLMIEQYELVICSMNCGKWHGLYKKLACNKYVQNIVPLSISINGTIWINSCHCCLPSVICSRNYKSVEIGK